MGEIFRAEQAHLDRSIAVKRLRRERMAEPESRAAFLAEAVVTGKLQHPNIVPVHFLQQSEQGLGLAMKLVEGRTWQEHLQKTPELLPHLEILLQVCNAVAYAHSRGFLHLDLKPSNIMLGDFGEVLVLDWGLAVRFGADAGGSRIRHCSSVQFPLGTPAFMAPEQALGRGDALGPWTDVFLLGGLLHRLLTGSPPHRGSQCLEVLRAAISVPVPVFAAEVPPELAQICRRALACDPKQRYGSVAQFQQDLREFLHHAESLQLTDNACSLLRAGQASSTARYQQFAQAVAAFYQAQQLWPGNRRAREGEAAARLAYARAAMQGGDLGLAEAQLRLCRAPEAAALLLTAQQLGRERARSQRTTRRLRFSLGAALLLVASIAVGSALTLWRLNDELRSSQADLRKRNAELLAAYDRRARSAEIREATTRRLVNGLREQLLAEGSPQLRAICEGLEATVLAMSQELDALDQSHGRSSRTTGLLALVSGDRLLADSPHAALREYRAGLQILAGLPEPDSSSPFTQNARGLGHLKIAQASRALGGKAEALASVRRALEIFERLARTAPEAVEPSHWCQAAVLCGELLEASGLREEALAVCQPELDLLASQEPGVQARALHCQHRLLMALGRYEEARAASEQAYLLMQGAVDNPVDLAERCRTTIVFARHLAAEGALEQAIDNLLALDGVLQERLPHTRPGWLSARLRVQQQAALGALYSESGQLPLAVQCFDESLRWQELTKQDPDITRRLLQLADRLRTTGDQEDWPRLFLAAVQPLQGASGLLESIEEPLATLAMGSRSYLEGLRWQDQLRLAAAHYLAHRYLRAERDGEGVRAFLAMALRQLADKVRACVQGRDWAALGELYLDWQALQPQLEPLCADAEWGPGCAQILQKSPFKD